MTPLLLASLLLAPPASGLDTPITLEVPNAPLTTVAKQLEQLSEVKINVRGAPERDWIYLKVKDRPLRQVLDSLAKLTDSTWKQSDGEIYLQAAWPAVDVQIAKRQQAVQTWMDQNPVPPALNTEGVKSLIREAIAVNENKLPTRDKEIRRLSALTPLNRAVRRIIEAIGAEELGTIPLNESRTYTVDRRSRTHQLPASTGQYVKDALQERTLLRREMELQNLNFENAQAQENYLFPLYLYFFDVEIDKYWCVTVTNAQDMLDVQIRFFGGENLHEQMATGIPISPLQNDPPPGDDGFNKLEDVFPIPPEWKAACEREGMRAALVDRNRDALTDFVHVAFDKAAKSLGTDVAAIINDGSFLWGSLQKDKVYSLGSVLRAAMMAPATISTADGMTLIRPLRLEKSRQSRIDRASLAQYLEDFARKGDEDVDMAAALAVANPEAWAYMHADAMIGMSTDRGEDRFYDPELLRVYGGLPEGQRQQSKNGGVTVAYRNLNADQKAAMERMYAWPHAGLRDPGGPPAISETSYFGRQVRNDIKLSLPATVPADAQVLIRLSSVSAYFAYEPELGVFQTDPNHLAYMKVFGDGNYGKNFKFAPATVSYLQVAANFGPTGWFCRSTEGKGKPDKKANWVSLNEMPKAFVDSYNQHIATNEAVKKQQGGG